jgi:2-haloacid dehalogenase
VSDMARREFLSAGGLSIAGAALGRTKSGAADEQAGPGVDALVFDTFGTVVDWRTSVIREGELIGRTHALDVDWATFADNWRGGYGPAMNRVRSGELPWTKLDDLHRMVLDQLIEDQSIVALSEREIENFNRVWHRLIPWPDSVPGLYRLKARFVIAPLSNGNVSLLTNMGKHAGLPWDCILSAELAGHYKPDPEVYLKACELLSLPPERVMMVAAHRGDLAAAKALGMKTALVHRPLEFGPARNVDTTDDERFDYNTRDFLELADRLGA